MLAFALGVGELSKWVGNRTVFIIYVLLMAGRTNS